ncbi:MAG: class I SAM-dependent methyltransferase [Lautropia sp.]
MRIRLRQYAFWWIGLAFLILAKLQHLTRGYRTPRAFSAADTERSIDYVRREVAEWQAALIRYGEPQRPFAGRRILELGPGPDLGVGVALLANGATSYAAMDVHELAYGEYGDYYPRLLTALGTSPELTVELQAAVTAARQGNPLERLEYRVRPDFDLVDAFRGRRFDLFVSQAAFEHFDDIERTIASLSRLAAADARLVFGIDFKTHSRWVGDKDVDPLSIYRYSDWLYRLLSFRGIPNRRPYSAYAAALAANGWTDLRYFDESSVDPETFAQVRPHLQPQFRADENRLLWIMLCARRAAPSAPAT